MALGAQKNGETRKIIKKKDFFLPFPSYCPNYVPIDLGLLPIRISFREKNFNKICPEIPKLLRL